MKIFSDLLPNPTAAKTDNSNIPPAARPLPAQPPIGAGDEPASVITEVQRRAHYRAEIDDFENGIGPHPGDYDHYFRSYGPGPAPNKPCECHPEPFKPSLKAFIDDAPHHLLAAVCVLVLMIVASALILGTK